ncbi:hypothetical protein [Mesorhizobium sp. NZP2298]|uniref:hypothetical protein n=1 Tax=Mesorhizobium sp. NZP2298 TaxID=2483403 RepID=UPI001552666D|nr:hypothetical protein [Mesorhizobium sp. NZP2298]QKC96793.1 hypothetical protein EB231_20455 [Mesorhizobium sp. NZP2298]
MFKWASISACVAFTPPHQLGGSPQRREVVRRQRFLLEQQEGGHDVADVEFMLIAHRSTLEPDFAGLDLKTATSVGILP